MIKEQSRKINSSRKIELESSSKLVSTSLEIPVTTVNTTIIKNRNLSVFESIIFELHHVKNYSITEISVMLNRDVNTISTVYRRAKSKNEKIQNSKNKGDF